MSLRKQATNEVEMYLFRCRNCAAVSADRVKDEQPAYCYSCGITTARDLLLLTGSTLIMRER